MTHQPSLFETQMTPYGTSYRDTVTSAHDARGIAYGQGQHPAVTVPEHADDLDRRFDAFIRANPHVLAEFVRRALDYKRAGYRTLRSKRIVEEMRDDYKASIDTGGSPWKMDNSLTSRLGRAAMAKCPELAGCFETRELRS